MYYLLIYNSTENKVNGNAKQNIEHFQQKVKVTLKH